VSDSLSLSTCLSCITERSSSALGQLFVKLLLATFYPTARLDHGKKRSFSSHSHTQPKPRPQVPIQIVQRSHIPAPIWLQTFNQATESSKGDTNGVTRSAKLKKSHQTDVCLSDGGLQWTSVDLVSLWVTSNRSGTKQALRRRFSEQRNLCTKAACWS